jgi:hypothetical protein
VIETPRGLQIEWDPQAVPAAPGDMKFVKVIDDGATRSYAFFTGAIETKSGGARVVIRATLTDQVAAADPSKSAVIGPELARLAPGTVAWILGDKVGGVHFPYWAWQSISVLVLQDAARLHAFIIPFSGAVPLAMTSGNYRMNFALDRNRWQTTDPPDAVNHYHSEATLAVPW